MRVAIYSHSISPSIDGVCRRFTGILWELHKQGHEIILFTLESQPQDLPPLLACVTLDHMIIPSYPGKKVARPSLSAFLSVWITLQKYRPEVLHVTADGFSHMFALISLLLYIPSMASFHTDLVDLLKTNGALQFQMNVVMLKEFIDGLVLDSAATTSKSFMTKLRKQGVCCEHVIQTAVDTDMFNPNRRSMALRNELMFGNKNGLLCVYVGRLSKEKRIDIIVDAVRNIDGAYLVVIGDGPIASQFAAMHGRENRFYCKPRFLSHADLAEIYASSDLHISASEFETLGNTVLEANACGVPVIVPRTQGFLDTVQDGKTGFLFEPGDRESCSRLIRRFHGNSALRSKMGTAAREAMANRSIQKVVEDILKWYSVGIHRHAEKRIKPLEWCFRLITTLVCVPLGVLILSCYDTLLALLLLVGYSPAQTIATAAVSTETENKARPQL